MFYQFLLENAHFAANIFGALVVSWVFWLYWDAWVGKKSFKESLRLLGFMLLSASFIVHAVYIEAPVLGELIIDESLHEVMIAATRIPAYLLLIISMILEPLAVHPHEEKEEEKDDNSKKFKTLKSSPLIVASIIIPGTALPLLLGARMALPVLAVICALLYLRRATLGIEFHLRSIAYSFFVLSIYELLSLADQLRKTSDIDLFNLVSPFGKLWIAEHVIFLIAVFILGKWVFAYLLKQIRTQLYMLFSVGVLVIFLITTITFSGLLLKNVQDETLSQLETNVNVLKFALETKQQELLSDAKVLAESSQLADAIEAQDTLKLADIAQSFLVTNKLSFLVIVNDTGQVVARGEDIERIGDSLSDDSLVKRAFLEEEAVSVGTRDGVLSSIVSLRASVPVKKEDVLKGAVLLGANIDNSFVDGLNEATGLSAAIYGDDKVSATTLTAEDGVTRRIGIEESNSRVKEKVLGRGEGYTGTTELVNVPYFVSYLPLKDINQTPVGMLFVGSPQVKVLQTAGASIELTFLVAAVLIVLSFIPSYAISKYIAYQIK